MSYPEPVYHGHQGEVSAWHRPFDAAPDIVYPNGNSTHYLVTGDRSDGLLGMYKWDMGPEPSGPGPHFHRGFFESFYVLLGTVKIFDGDEWIDTQPGDYLHVPPGGLHGFRNESGEPASMLLIFGPGAPRESYFEGLLTLGDLSAGQRAEFMQYHDNHWVDTD